MTSKTLPPNPRHMRWERYAGVTPQFERVDGGYLFRRDRCGPAIRVSIAERDAFAAAGRRALLWHVAALLVCGAAGWLAVDRLINDGGEITTAILLGIVEALIAMILYASLRWHADAPGRALAGRPIERPARDPDFAKRLDTVSIIGLMLVLPFMICLSTLSDKVSVTVQIGLISASVMLGLFLLVRRWRFNRSLSPEQRARAREVARHERVRDGAPDRHPIVALLVLLVLFVFVFAEIVAVYVGFNAGSGFVLDGARQTFATADGATTTGAILLGLVTALVSGGLVELISLRVIGASPFLFLWAITPNW